MKMTSCFLLAACMVCVARAQDTTSDSNQPPPRDLTMKSNGNCQEVHPGDTVHYTLTIENVEEAKVVLGQLRMRPDGHLRYDPIGGLPHPDFRNLGGGGTGTRSPQDQKIYSFAFKVPIEILSGTYRGVGVYVTTNEEAALSSNYRVTATRHAQDEIAHYCLNVLSTFGGKYKPLITDFKPGAIDPKQ